MGTMGHDEGRDSEDHVRRHQGGHARCVDDPGGEYERCSPARDVLSNEVLGRRCFYNSKNKRETMMMRMSMLLMMMMIIMMVIMLTTTMMNMFGEMMSNAVKFSARNNEALPAAQVLGTRENIADPSDHDQRGSKRLGDPRVRRRLERIPQRRGRSHELQGRNRVRRIGAHGIKIGREALQTGRRCRAQRR